ncbi:MAG: hypothetical protein ABSH09_14570 [Bryobacteraceae bacterium]
MSAQTNSSELAIGPQSSKYVKAATPFNIATFDPEASQQSSPAFGLVCLTNTDLR